MSITDNTNTLRVILDKVKALPDRNGNNETYNLPSNEENVIYDAILAEKTYLQGSPINYYYYYDDTNKKIRYIILNVSRDDSITDQQIAWLQETVQLPSSEWKIIAFGHVDILPNDPISYEWQVARIEDVVDTLSNTNGKVIGYFCGHEHHDRIEVINESFHEVILLNDKLEQNDEFVEITNPTRTPNTVTEHAISVVSANLSTGMVYIRRIGAGNDMQYNFLSLSGGGNTGGDTGGDAVSNETTWTNNVPYTYEPITGEYMDGELGTTFEPVEYSEWSHTPYLYCEGASTLRIRVAVASYRINDGENGTWCSFFDENKKSIEWFEFQNIDVNTVGAYLDFTIPSNAEYLLISLADDVMGVTTGKPFVEFIPLA